MKKKLENSDDVKLLVDGFYDKIKNDNLLGFIFNEIANVNWEKHLSRMYGFWEMLLFSKAGYEGQPLMPHLAINQQYALSVAHFDRWIQLFTETVDEYFEGEIANEAKIKAKNIALTWAHKIDYINKLNK